jgi:hypothetical protein
MVRRVERRLRRVDVLEELLTRRVRSELRREQADDEEDDEDGEGDDADPAAAVAGDGLPPRPTAGDAGGDGLEPGCGVEMRFQ